MSIIIKKFISVYNRNTCLLTISNGYNNKSIWTIRMRHLVKFDNIKAKPKICLRKHVNNNNYCQCFSTIIIITTHFFFFFHDENIKKNFFSSGSIKFFAVLVDQRVLL